MIQTAHTRRRIINLPAVICCLFFFVLLMNLCPIPTHAKGNVLKVIYSDESTTVEEVFTYQCEDGGFTYGGETGDSDTTAMVLQYLAGEELTEEQLSAYEHAWDCLMTFYTEEGDFLNFYDQHNSETNSQVVLAMVAGLKAGYYSDEELLHKTAKHLYDTYSVEGGFCHLVDAGWNQMATNQGNQAMDAYSEYTGVDLRMSDIPGAEAETDAEVTQDTPDREELPDTEGSREEAGGQDTEAEPAVSHTLRHDADRTRTVLILVTGVLVVALLGYFLFRGDEKPEQKDMDSEQKDADLDQKNKDSEQGEA